MRSVLCLISEQWALVTIRGLCGLGLVTGRQRDSIIECQTLLRQWEQEFVLSVYHSVNLFRRSQAQFLQWLLCDESWWTSSRNRTWNHRAQRRLVRPERRTLGLSVPVARRKRIPDCCSHDVGCRKEQKKLLLRAHKTCAGTHTHTLTHIHPQTHTHTPTDTHSYTQYGNKPNAKCTRDHTHIHTHQTQLTPTSRSRNVLVVSPRHVVSRVCILLNISSYIAGRRYHNNISFKSRLNYICGVFRFFNWGCYRTFFQLAAQSESQLARPKRPSLPVGSIQLGIISHQCNKASQVKATEAPARPPKRRQTVSKVKPSSVTPTSHLELTSEANESTFQGTGR